MHCVLALYGWWHFIHITRTKAADSPTNTHLALLTTVGFDVNSRSLGLGRRLTFRSFLLVGSCKIDKRGKKKKKERTCGGKKGGKGSAVPTAHDVGGNGMQLGQGCASACPVAINSSVVISTNSSLLWTGTLHTGEHTVEVFLHGNCYASTAELTRLTADDGFGADVWQSYGETFGKCSASSRQSQNYSSG